VPQIGCKCPVCTSSDPRDRRRRCGAYVTSEKVAFLIDTPPEMRLACIEYGVERVDAICLTHAHMDHVAGFDDVRRFNTINGGVPMRCFAMPETIDQMHNIFPYISDKKNAMGLFRPMINFVSNEKPFMIGDVAAERLEVEHSFPCCGYMFREQGTGNGEQVTGNREQGTGNRGQGSVAYISDCHEIPEATLKKLEGVDVLILNCLRERFHPTHLNLEASLAYIDRIKPGRAYLVHMCHDLSHKDYLSKLPKGVEPAYDGLEIDIRKG